MTHKSITYLLSPITYRILKKKGYNLTCTVCHQPLREYDMVHRNGKTCTSIFRGRVRFCIAKFKHQECYERQFV